MKIDSDLGDAWAFFYKFELQHGTEVRLNSRHAVSSCQCPGLWYYRELRQPWATQEPSACLPHQLDWVLLLELGPEGREEAGIREVRLRDSPGGVPPEGLSDPSPRSSRRR